MKVGDLVKTTWIWLSPPKTGIITEIHPEWYYPYVVFHQDNTTAYYQRNSLEKWNNESR